MAVENGFGVTETARRLSISVKTLADWGYALPAGQARGRVEAGRERAGCGVGATEKRDRPVAYGVRHSKKSGSVLCQGVAVRYAAASALRHRYPVRFVCLVLQVSVSGYYAWLKRNEAPSSKAIRIEAEVLAAHQRICGTYGAERLCPSTSESQAATP